MNPELTIGILVLAQSFIAEREAHHDYHLINDSSITGVLKAYQWEDKKRHNKAWHTQDAITWTLVHSALAFAVWNPILLLTGLAWRFALFPVVLNVLRNKKPQYLGSGSIDMGTYKVVSFFIRPVIKILKKDKSITSEVTQKTVLIFKLLIIATLAYYAADKIIQGILQG